MPVVIHIPPGPPHATVDSPGSGWKHPVHTGLALTGGGHEGESHVNGGKLRFQWEI